TKLLCPELTLVSIYILSPVFLTTDKLAYYRFLPPILMDIINCTTINIPLNNKSNYFLNKWLFLGFS
ncbi:MAG: hypothetical protein ACM3RX_02430, partial [Methanococcaceae archaeon]